MKLRDYPGTVRQLVVTGLGRDAPTVIITNDHTSTAKHLIERYACRRMGIEQRLAEIIRAFHADALSSAVNLNVDLDIALCVLAQALLAALGARLPGYAAVTPDTLQRRFLQTPGEIIPAADTITVRLDRRAYIPVLRQAAPPSPGGATEPCATNTPEPCPEPPAWISALSSRFRPGGAAGYLSSSSAVPATAGPHPAGRPSTTSATALSGSSAAPMTMPRRGPATRYRPPGRC